MGKRRSDVKNEVGNRYGRLTVLRLAEKPKSVSPTTMGGVYWLCRCDCGNVTTSRGATLRNGTAKSCGCLQQEVTRSHGMEGTKTYEVWSSMKARCQNPKHRAFKNYGGRGIRVCKRWQKFEGFLADMGKKPASRSLDRIDNEGNYEPGNCRWATWLQQGRNRRPPRTRKGV